MCKVAHEMDVRTKYGEKLTRQRGRKGDARRRVEGANVQGASAQAREGGRCAGVGLARATIPSAQLGRSLESGHTAEKEEEQRGGEVVWKREEIVMRRGGKEERGGEGKAAAALCNYFLVLSIMSCCFCSSCLRHCAMVCCPLGCSMEMAVSKCWMSWASRSAPPCALRVS